MGASGRPRKRLGPRRTPAEALSSLAEWIPKLLGKTPPANSPEVAALVTQLGPALAGLTQSKPFRNLEELVWRIREGGSGDALAEEQLLWHTHAEDRLYRLLEPMSKDGGGESFASLKVRAPELISSTARWLRVPAAELEAAIASVRVQNTLSAHGARKAIPMVLEELHLVGASTVKRVKRRRVGGQ